MNLYEILSEISNKGYQKISINLAEKSLTVGKQNIIDKGVVQQHKIIIGEDTYEFDKLIESALDIDELYKQYKYSVPSEHDNGKCYFKALKATQLTDAQLVCGEPRLAAKVRLEAYVLLASLAGMLTWQNDEHWFWQSEKDKNLIVLRKFV